MERMLGAELTDIWAMNEGETAASKANRRNGHAARR